MEGARAAVESGIAATVVLAAKAAKDAWELDEDVDDDE